MDRLTENHFSFKCPMRWEDMAISANGRFCEQCRKEVYDLSNCTVDEVIALQKQHGSICGSIRVVRAAAVAVTLSAAACEDGSKSRTGGVIAPPSPSHEADNRVINVMPGTIKRIPPKQEVMVPGEIAPIEQRKNPEAE
jgi:hypothetical protein